MVTKISENAEAILEAAAWHMREYGDAGLRVNDVAVTARCNKRLIYHYYNNREGLVLAVYQRQAGILLRRDSGLSASTQRFLKSLLYQCEPRIRIETHHGPITISALDQAETGQKALGNALVILMPLMLRGMVQSGLGFMHNASFDVEDLQKVASELVVGLVVDPISESDSTSDSLASEISKHSQTSSKPRYRMASASRVVD
jgi:AcrR family transcriptional regulator